MLIRFDCDKLYDSKKSISVFPLKMQVQIMTQPDV